MLLFGGVADWEHRQQASGNEATGRICKKMKTHYTYF
jgi:hypothetical protein